VSEDADTAVVRALLERGFRWIHAEGGGCVGEKSGEMSLLRELGFLVFFDY